jgi:hypothetical protein
VAKNNPCTCRERKPCLSVLSQSDDEPKLKLKTCRINNIIKSCYLIPTYSIFNLQIFAPLRVTLKRCVVGICVGFAKILEDEISPSERQINLHRHFSIWSESINMVLSNEDN